MFKLVCFSLLILQFRVSQSEDDTCKKSLGAAINGSLPDSAFTASSESRSYGAKHGRLSKSLKAWIPILFQPSGNIRIEYLQIDLGDIKTVTAISTKGLNGGAFFVKSYSLRFGNDGEVFDPYLQAKTFKEFMGNTDSNTVVTRKLPCPVTARYIRIYPLEYVVGIALKVDVLGCDDARPKDDKIKNFRLLSVASNSLVLSWEQKKSNVAVMYVAYYPVGGSKLPHPNFAVGVQKTSSPIPYVKRITALTSCTVYKFILRVFDLVGCGIPDVYTLNITTRPSRPIPPQNLVTDNSIPETIMVRWKISRIGYQCSGDITSFTMYYRELYSTKFRNVILNPKSTHFNITGLKSWKRYVVQIAAVNSLGQSDWEVSTVDVDGKPPEEAPVIETLISNEPNSFFIKWKNPPEEKINGPITGYSINYRLQSEDSKVNSWIQLGLTNTGSNTFTKIKPIQDPLQPWKVYDIYVSFYNLKYNKSSAVKDVLILGKAPGKAPENLTILLSTETEVKLKWDPVPSTYLPNVFNGYQVVYSEENENTILSHNLTTTNTQLLVKNLKMDTKYVFSVAAISNNIVGPYSSGVNMSTASGPLPSPIITMLASNHPNTFEVKWIVNETVDEPVYILHYKQHPNLDTWMSKHVGNVLEISIVKLKSWQQYDLKIELQSRGRKSESLLLPVLVIGKFPGSSPTNIKAVNVTYQDVTLHWDEIDPAYLHGPLVEYAIKYRIGGNTNSFKFENTTKRKITITGLTHDSMYQFQVAGKNELGVGIYSDPLPVKTVKIIVPRIPTISELKSKSPTKITFKWKSPDMDRVDFTKIIIRFKDTSGNVTKVNSYIMKGTATLTVASYTNYTIDMKICVNSECSGYSPPVNIMTQEDMPSEVQNLQISSTSDDVTVSWQLPKIIPGIIRKYIIDVRNLATDTTINNYPISVPHDTLSYVLQDLTPYTDLQVIVKAFTVAPGPGAKAQFHSPEGIPEKPSNVLVILLKDDTMSIKWDEPDLPNGIITHYKIEYTGIKVYDKTFYEDYTLIVNATEKTKRIGNLVPGTLYRVRIYAKTVKGYGVASAERQITTPTKAPKEPEPPVVYASEVLSNSIPVQLKPAKQTFGEITSYQVLVEEILDKNVNDVSGKRKRRSTKLPDIIYGYDLAKQNNMNIYIAADISAQEVKFQVKFIIGDGKTYNGYRNEQLKPETSYKLYVRATSKVGQNVPMYGPPASAIFTTGKPKDDPTPFPIPIPVLIGVGAAIILIIVIVVVVVIYIQSSRRKKKDKMDPYELGLIRVRSASDSAPERPASLTGDYPLHPDHPPIPVSTFPKQVAKLHRSDNNGFKAEYNQLEIGKEFSWDVAHLPENKPKNRYANIVAYDHSRVTLSKIDGLPGSDYINASYIDGFKKPNAYICTQGPLPATFNDFWRMVWESRSTTVVMLTNLQEKNKLKCHKYWPDDCTEYAEIIVTLVRKELFADYTIRTFKLEKVPRQKNFKHEIREIKQFHFTSWPDHGVPNYSTSILNFRRKVRFHLLPEAGPTIVHCSAGVGRTGAYIVIDAMLDRVQGQMDIDVFNTIAAMRTKRIAMVQTEDQYIFVHDSIVEAVLSGNTQILVNDLRTAIRRLDQIQSDSKVSAFEKQWKALNHTSPNPPKTEFQSAIQGENSFKNRFSTVLPADESRVLLLPMNDNEATTYINAVYVDSYKKRNAFILTQSPLPKTVTDFWRMVCEHGISTIVMLNAVDEGDDYVKFWPENGTREYDMISVECTSSSKKDDLSFNSSLKPMYRTLPTELVVRNFEVTDTRNPSKSCKVKIFQYVGWTETRVPNTYKAVINLITQIDRWQQQSCNGPVTIMCSDGIGRSGTLAAIMYVLERVKIDQVFDAFQAVKQMRIQRPHVVKYMDQYKYIHFAVQEYLNAFEDYTKF